MENLLRTERFCGDAWQRCCCCCWKPLFVQFAPCKEIELISKKWLTSLKNQLNVAVSEEAVEPVVAAVAVAAVVADVAVTTTRSGCQ